ncbi:MAG: type II secretion system F family protein [Holosporaceae bacterium]|nr:type II secretion system F family protein [Holosporaceae bacterium]
MLKRMAKVSRTKGAADHTKENKNVEEGIGLSSNGPILGTNYILSYIAKKNKGSIRDMQQLLQKAGMRQQDALEKFMKYKFIVGIFLFFISLIFSITSDMKIPFEIGILASLLVAVVGGHKLTDMDMGMRAKKRKERIENGVPDLVDLLVICSESGLGLNRSIKRIARELRASNSVLADELSQTAIELEMIPDYRTVFENLENRTDCVEIKTLSKTLCQSIEYGSSLTTSLRDLAMESRQRRMLNAEAKAAQAPTLLTLPMMLFIMPCLFIVMLGPIIINVMKTFNQT